MSISSEEIVGRPDSLFTQELWRPDVFTAIEILWVASESPVCRSARSDSLRITEGSALDELSSIREWWSTVANVWEDGQVIRVVHDGEPTDDEINVWMDLNLVVPWFRDKLANEHLVLEEIQMMTAWHKING
jgi:hypothetical protein